MKSLLEKLIKRPVIICTIIILIIGFGIMSMLGMNINLLPNMNMPFLAITCVYPGASSKDVEKNVTYKLEEGLKTVSEIEGVTTYSIDNACIIQVEFGYDVDIEKKQEEVKNKLSKIELPKECGDINISTVDLNASSVCSVSLLSTTNDIESLVSDGNRLKDLIYNIDGVGSVSLNGIPEYNIELRSLNGLDLTILMVSEGLASLNYDIPLGSIISNGSSIAITNTSNAKSLEELKNMPISIKLNSLLWETLRGLNDTLTDYNNCTLEELDKSINKAKDIKKFIDEVDNYTLEELEDLNDNLTLSSFMINLIRNNTSIELKMMYNQVIKPMTTDEAFLNATDEDLENIAVKNNMNKVFLKKVQEYSKDGSLESRWNEFVNLRKYYEDNNLIVEDITYKEYVDTFLKSGFLEIDYPKSDPLYINEYNDLIDKCEFSDSINSVMFNQIVEFRRDIENEGKIIPDEYYAALFYDSKYSEEFGICQVPQFINIVRQSTFEENCKLIRDFKIEYLELNKEMKSEDFELLFNDLKFDTEPKLQLTLDVINLIRNINYDEIIEENGEGLLVLPLDMLCHVERVSNIDIYSEYNGIHSLTIDVYTQPNSNITSVVNSVRKIIDSNHFDSEVYLLNDQASFISESIESVIVSMIIGALLAVVVIFLFIGKVRTSLIVSITMPVSVLAAVIVLYLQNITLNMVSLGGLAVGIGMLVDNSIVVIESISTKRQQGLTPFDSAVNGTKEVASSLVASTLTTICVFFPILFTKGLTKEIFQDLSFAVIYSIIFSLLVAIFIIPTLYYLLHKKDDVNKVYENKCGRIDKVFNKIINFYDKILVKALKHKVAVVISSLAVFILSLVLVLTSGFEFMPSVDKRLIEISCDYDVSVNKEEAIKNTNIVVDEINNSIKDIKYITYRVGKLSSKDQALSSLITLELKESDLKTNDACQIIRDVVSDNEGVFVVTNIDGVVANITGGMAQNGITIRGDDYDELIEVSDKICEEFKNIKGITGVSDNITSETICYDFIIDKQKCEELEIDYANTVTLLRLGLSGYDLATIKLDGENNEIIKAEFNELTKENLDSILNVIVGYNSDVILLEDIVTVKETLRPSVITRSDNLYSITINVETYNVDTGSVTNQMNKCVDKILLDYKSVTYNTSGVSSFLLDAFGGLVVALIVSFLLLYAVMACQFESLSKPFIVICSIPLAFTGAFVGLFITRFSLDVVSFVGIIMLMGIVVNDAIVMVDKIDLNIKEGMDTYSAIIDGAKSRFRAIWMTSLTTILALIPLALAIGRGSELMQPMGIVVIGGLLLSTIVTLVLIPSLYAIIKKVKTK